MFLLFYLIKFNDNTKIKFKKNSKLIKTVL